MRNVSKLLIDAHPVTDLRDCQLGDKRMNERYPQLIEALNHRPDASIPETFDEASERKAYYRFVENEKLDFRKLLQPHYEATAQRAEKLGEVLVIHDTTEFAFPIHDGVKRENLVKLSANRQGFLLHSSLVCSADGVRAPLGLIDAQPFVHKTNLEKGEAEDVDYWSKQNGVFENESHRWLKGVEASEERLDKVGRVIHVADRENDDYEHIVCMGEAGYDFIIRAKFDRNISTGERRKDFEKLTDVFERSAWLGGRTILLSKRAESQASKQHPERRDREATIQVRVVQVKVRRPNNVPSDLAPDCTEVTAVEVLETEPPQGEDPVRWVLFTSLACVAMADIWKVVDLYRARWVTEEFYKATKTGCAFLKLQHRSADTLLNALALKMQVAWQLLLVRYLGQRVEDLPAKAVVNPLQFRMLQNLKPNFFAEKPTAREVMLAVASLGGHFKHNKQPGWIVLGRGWQKLREYERGAQIAMRL